MNMAQARRRIEETAELNAFICLTDETEGDTVIAVKDLIDVRGVPTTGGGVILPKTPAVKDAQAVALARAAGCGVVGKTNMHEWAYGVTSDNPHYGAALNPRDPTRSAGGSSSGSAVAVAAGACDWAIGTDTAGSIRVPASLCGVVGYKPTNGTVSTQGVIPLAYSLDAVGALAPDVATAAHAVDVMSGGALSSRPSPAKKRYRIGVPDGWVQGGLDAPTSTAWSLVSAGLPQILFPSREEMFRMAEVIQRWEATAYHREWLESRPKSYGADVLRRLQSGFDVSQTDYMAACRARSEMRASVVRAMEGIDALLLPTTACVAPTLETADRVREPLIRFTRPFNLTAQPVISLPAPVPGLPVGIQVIGKYGDDSRLVAVAESLEAKWGKPRDGARP